MRKARQVRVVGRWRHEGTGKGPTAPRSSPRTPRNHAATAGEPGGTPHPPALGDSPEREPAPGPPGSSLRPAPPAARLRQDKQASAAATPGPSGARSPPCPPRLPGVGLGRSRSRAAGRTLSLLPSARSS